MTTLQTIKEENNNCHTCDNYLFSDKYFKVDTTDGKIKLCSKLCFEKYMIMVAQMKMKRKVKQEKKVQVKL